MNKKIYYAPQTELTDFVMVAALCGSPEPVTEEIGGQTGKPGATTAPRRRPF